MAPEVVVSDAPQAEQDLETQLAFDEGQRLSENLADDDDIREAARRAVEACLQRVEPAHRQRVVKWQKLDKLWQLYSLSPNAEAFQIHLAAAFEAAEEFSVKMSESIFGVHGFLQAKPKAYDADPDKAKLLAELVETQMRDELEMESDALQDLREAAIFGTYVDKITPERTITRSITRSVEGVKMLGGGIRYKFGKPEEHELAPTRYRRDNVHLYDFRTEETFGSIRKAVWCGDFSYPAADEVLQLADRGDYSAKAVEEFASRYIDWETRALADTANYNIGHGYVRIGSIDRLLGAHPDAGPHIIQFARFEWWGDFQIERDGDYLPCVITTIHPVNNFHPIILGNPTQYLGEVVQVRKNPYFHQRKPFAAFRVVPRKGQFYGMGVVEITGRHSHLEDELATAALQTAQLEAAPPLAIGENSGIDQQQLPGFLPGAILPGENVSEENLRFIQHPQVSGAALAAAQWFETRSKRTAGFGSQSVAPRVAAAGVIKTAQEEDLSIIKYVRTWESDYAADVAALVDGYNKQYLTEERKIQALGSRGLGVPDIRTIRPDDLAVQVDFQPLASRKLVQKAFQNQQMLNLLDRGAAMNVQRQLMGQPPIIDEVELLRVIFADGYGIRTFDRILIPTADPRNMRTAEQEHELYGLGERPGVQKGENVLMHFHAHTAFVRAGGSANWHPADRQAFIDHIHETAREILRAFEAAAPNVTQLVQAMLQGMGAPTDRGGPEQPGSSQGQAGGRGFAPMGMQQRGSPLLRSPLGSSQIQGESMSAAPNLGAA